jgi:hypothetical protein
MAHGSARLSQQCAVQAKMQAKGDHVPVAQAKLKIRAGEDEENVERHLGTDTCNGDPYIQRILGYLKSLAAPPRRDA